MSLQQECPQGVTVDPITTPAICGYQEEVCPNDYTSCCPIRSRKTRGGGARRKKKNNKSKRGNLKNRKQRKNKSKKTKKTKKTKERKKQCRGKRRCS